MLGKEDIHMQKKENRTLPPACKNQLKIDYLTEELETIKILEEKVTEDVMLSLMKIIPKLKKKSNITPNSITRADSKNLRKKCVIVKSD